MSHPIETFPWVDLDVELGTAKAVQAAMVETIAHLLAERNEMLANLTATQARCDELLEENRRLRALLETGGERRLSDADVKAIVDGIDERCCANQMGFSTR